MSAPDAVPLAAALRYWLRLGLISFGGPAGQIAIMHRDLVEQRRWISEGRFLHALNYCMLLPGPEAQQLATYIGWLMHGTRGALAAGLLFVLPSLLILIALSWAYLALGSETTGAVLYGVRPAVLAIILFAAWRIGRKVLKSPVLWALALGALIALLMQLPFPAVIALAGICGWLLRARLSAAPAHAASAKAAAPLGALHDDHTPLPAHARASRSDALRVLAVGSVLGALAWAILLLASPALYAQIAAFFTRAALVTFGGAYAVMPYVFQNAVADYGWLTATQMMDGLALGESTPGPLIMVVAYIGFVAAWTQQALGADALLLAGVLGAVVATFFTFLPSFIFILAGAPLVEATRGDFRLSGPLTAITAAVVGTILSLAIYFGRQLLWPAGGFDAVAALLTVVALWLLYRERVGTVGLIGLGALGGVLLQALPI